MITKYLHTNNNHVNTNLKFLFSKLFFDQMAKSRLFTGACPGIRKGGGGQNLKAFFFFFFTFQFFRRGPAQKIAEKVIFSTKKVAKYR